ncbi:MAG: S-methyl-5'-thioinosine phosphorylase [Chromatiales bacterium]
MIGILAGSGAQQLAALRVEREQSLSTAYGDPSGPLLHGSFAGVPVVFLNRHGPGHTLAPHRINYRANLHALSQAGASTVIAIAAVGGITTAMSPARIVLPSQIIDYTYGRDHTFFDDAQAPVTHVDFTKPYSEPLRQCLLDAARAAGVDVAADAVYGATQGPRLETAAEIDRMARDGCDIVGMTGMPEAGLAREIGLAYACCAVVANWAAGRAESIITMKEMRENLAAGMREALRLLAVALPIIAAALTPAPSSRA